MGRSWEQKSIKNRYRKRYGNRKARKLDFDRFLIDLGAILASKTEPRRSKIDVEIASKFDQFLKASWNTIFSAQEPPRGASAANRRSGGSRPEATGGGFRRGKTRTSKKKNPEGDRRKDSKTSCAHLTRRARWAADCRRLRLGTAAPVY